MNENYLGLIGHRLMTNTVSLFAGFYFANRPEVQMVVFQEDHLFLVKRKIPKKEGV